MGDIDDLLTHCASVTDQDIDNALELEKCIEQVMKEFDLDRNEAMDAIEQAHLNEVRQTIEDLMEKGMIEIKGYDDAGNALYGPTKKGMDIMNQMDQN